MSLSADEYRRWLSFIADVAGEKSPIPPSIDVAAGRRKVISRGLHSYRSKVISLAAKYALQDEPTQPREHAPPLPELAAHVDNIDSRLRIVEDMIAALDERTAKTDPDNG